MKRILLLIIAMVVIGNLIAIGENDKTVVNSETSTAYVTLNGKVVDKQTGEVLTGAYVQLEGTEIFTYTDFDGSFTFNNLKPGTYTAVVTFISYEKGKVDIEISKKKDVKIELETASL